MPATFRNQESKERPNLFNLKATNGEVILTSEMYKAKASTRNGIESVKKNAADASRYAKQTSKNGKHYFTLKAANSQVIGNSEMYESEQACEKGIKSVMKNAPGAAVKDLSLA